MNLKQLQELPIDKLVSYYNEESVESLLKIKGELDDLYYNDETEFDDFRYDMLKDTLERRVGPSKAVGAVIRPGEKKKNLPFWLGSMNKITGESEFDKWMEKYPGKTCLTYKLDGVSCLLEYDGENTFLYTRGNGSIGTDISHLVEYINLPKLQTSISAPASTPVFVRGSLFYQRKILKNIRTNLKMLETLYPA